MADEISAGKADGLIQAAEFILNSAIDDQQKAKLRDVTAYLTRASALSPKSDAGDARRATIAFNFGRVHLELGENSKALKLFHEAIQEGNPDARNYEPQAAGKLAETYYKDKRLEDAFLVSAISFFDARKGQEGAYFSPQFIWSLGKLYRLAGASKPPSALSDCDVLAGVEEDPLGVAPGVKFAALDSSSAIAACRKAVQQQPENARFHFELGRALGQLAHWQRSQKQVTPADNTDAHSLVELEQAMDHGYPWAFLYSATNYIFGFGSERDETKGNSLAIQAFNRTLSCCWGPIARKLLEGHNEQDPAIARRMIISMTAWAAALGNRDSASLYLKLAGTKSMDAFPVQPKADFAALPPWVK